MSELAEAMLVLNEWTEGTNEHTDSTAEGIRTAPYGVIIDSTLDPKSDAGKAYIRNRRIADEMGYDIDNLTTEQARDVAGGIIEEDTEKLAAKVKGWEELETPYKLFLMDAKFNTGQTFNKFAAQALKYQEDPSQDNLEALIKQTTRKEKRKGMDKSQRTAGMDNRSTKILLAGGILENEDQARDLGLYLTTDTGFADHHRLNNILEDIRESEKETDVEEAEMSVEDAVITPEAASLDSGMITPVEDDLLVDSVTGASMVGDDLEPVEEPEPRAFIPSTSDPIARRARIRARIKQRQEVRKAREMRDEAIRARQEAEQRKRQQLLETDLSSSVGGLFKGMLS